MFLKFLWPHDRLDRTAYFLYSILIYIVLMVIILLFRDNLFIFESSQIYKPTLAAKGLGVVYIFIKFGLAVRRGHDFNARGWITIILFLFIHPIAEIFYLLLSGDKKENRFGPPV